MHDCQSCTYLGSYHECDLYFCQQSTGSNPTVIARYSSRGPDYSSGLHGALHIPELIEARARAIDAGLLSESNAVGLTVNDLALYLAKVAPVPGYEEPRRETIRYVNRKIQTAPLKEAWLTWRRADWLAWICGMMLPNVIMAKVLDDMLQFACAPPISPEFRQWFLTGKGYRANGIVVAAMPMTVTVTEFNDMQARFTEALRMALPWSVIEPALRQALVTNNSAVDTSANQSHAEAA